MNWFLEDDSKITWFQAKYIEMLRMRQYSMRALAARFTIINKKWSLKNGINIDDIYSYGNQLLGRDLLLMAEKKLGYEPNAIDERAFPEI